MSAQNSGSRKVQILSSICYTLPKRRRLHCLWDEERNTIVVQISLGVLTVETNQDQDLDFLARQYKVMKV
jgi:hypothetical protein